MPPVILSAGRLVDVGRSDVLRSGPPPSVSLFNDLRMAYDAIYRTQPNVRTVVGFLARNVAQLAFPLYRRESDQDRRKLTDHPFALRMRRPNPVDPRMTRFRLIHSVVRDLGVYDTAFWTFVGAGSGAPPAILRLPPNRVTVRGSNIFWPEAYEITGPRGGKQVLPADAVVQFIGSLGLDDSYYGEPPIESLRRILAEDEAAGEFREQFWRGGARISGWIERPERPPGRDWSPQARKRFIGGWNQAWTGAGTEAGGTPVLEDGMKYHEAGQSLRDSQYVEGRQLTRVEVAAAYHVDPVFVGVTETAGRASMEERHKSLYMDTLAPWVVMLDQDLTMQVLPYFVDDPAEVHEGLLYVEANIADKLRGTPADMAESINRLVGRPVLTANEGRALLNRDALDEGDGLVLPLNVVIGGQTTPGASPVGEPEVEPGAASRRSSKAAGVTPRARAALHTEHEAIHRQALARTFGRQRRAFLSALGAARPGASVEDLFDRDRWDQELAADLLGPAIAAAGAVAAATAEALGGEVPDTDAFLEYLSTNAGIAARNVNGTTLDQLGAALLDDDPPAAAAHVFDIAETSRSDQIARTRVTGLAGFAMTNTASSNGWRAKTWLVNSSNPRASHAVMDGETVPVGELFSIGGAWPGDASMGADETAGCSCSLEFVAE